VPSAISLLLLAVAAAIGLVDCLWAEKAGFMVASHAYAVLAAISGICWLAGWFYEAHRPEPRLAAMLTGTGFLVAFTAGASVLNAMLLTVAGPRVDWLFARADIAMGFDWPAMMRLAAGHPAPMAVLRLVYMVLVPEIALAVLVLGTLRGAAPVYRFCLAIAAGAMICIAIWTAFPAFGAMSVYHLDPATAARLNVPVDGAYGEMLVRMLREGPGLIAPNMKGLIGFPSYHAVLALLLMWYFRSLHGFRWIIWGLNGLVVLATPIAGGHHMIDVLAGVPVTFLAIAIARWVHGLGVGRDGMASAQAMECLEAGQRA